MYHAHIIRYLLLVILFSLSRLYSAEIISGYIIDAKTGDPLPAANLQIEGTLRGAITNQDGKFNLEIEALPAAVLVSYIGYESERVMINTAAEKTLTIELNPVILEMEAIEVTAEDPAMNIMRKVIEKKKVWRKNLKTYQAEAYSRVSLSNDSGIVVIAESISRAFWDAEKGPREVILNKRQTGNIKDEHNLVAASYIPNFYDDDVEINGFKIIGVTHPDALDYYRFKLTGRRMRDDKIVYDIDVIPASILQPTFSGRIAVLDEDYALLNVDLRSNESILFPPPIQEWNIYYKQQFSNFGREFWLPVDVREDGDILIGITGLQFPKIKYNQLSHLNDYQVNIPLPDSLYKEEKIVFTDSAAVDSVDLFIDNPGVVPLTVEEDKAYEGIDSAMTIEKAFKPSGF
ncbi:MAG: carboxypeptidase-like regulatory domain-containing protein, partial [Calditrichaceae bacterium]|nr:carboxypeptidase-like regulatory domain-containing protein [Calditrichaceae bacterium]